MMNPWTIDPSAKANTHSTSEQPSLPNNDSIAETLRALLQHGRSSETDALLRAVGYTRVSSAIQLEDGTSLEDQEARIREYIQSRNWVTVSILSDPAQSGRSGNRPDFRRLCRLVRRQQIDVIVVDRIDRISRNLFTLLKFIKLLNDHGVKLVSLREQIDFSTIWGQLVLYILGALAEFYSSVLAQEIRLQRYHAAKAGRLSGAFRLGLCKGNCSACSDPNGPDYCPAFDGPDRGDGHIRVLHPVESHAVRLMFDWYTTGDFSDSDIARKLNAEVFTVPDESNPGYQIEVHFRTKGRPGICPPGPFDKDAVRAILTNPIYAGFVTYAGSDDMGNKRRKPVEIFPGQHPAIVDLETFRRVQAIRRQRYHRSHSRHAKARTYPLSRLVFCAHAKSPMRGISSGGGRYRYYSDKLCRLRLPKDQWHQPNVSADDVEALVQRLVTQVSLPQEWRERILVYLVYDDGVDEMEEEKYLIRQRLRRARELYTEGEYSREQFERIRAACQRDLAALAPSNVPIGHEALALLDNPHTLWEALTDAEKNALYQAMLDGIYVRGKAVECIDPRPAFRALLQDAASRLEETSGEALSYHVGSPISA